MPCNLYGFGDNFDLETSHVLPALIRKIDHAKRNNINCDRHWPPVTQEDEQFRQQAACTKAFQEWRQQQTEKGETLLVIWGGLQQELSDGDNLAQTVDASSCATCSDPATDLDKARLP